MCGIAGIYNIDQDFPIPKTILEEMTNVMIHRGPDDSGFFLSDRVGLGHRRLSIIDLKTGRQPMCDDSETIWIVFNGEIYNYKQLKKDLELEGYIFKTNADTEVIIYLYKKFGNNCLSHLIGMFAFAIYDKNQNALFLARDRLGVKPLYYTVVNGQLLFASEIKALLNHPNVKKKVNPYAISSYLTYRYVLGNETFFKDIFILEPGFFIVCKVGDIRQEQYWDLPIIPEKTDLGEDFYIKHIKRLMKRSVERRLISDVPLGAYLSGGLDSSIIVAIMSEINDSPIKTYSIAFEEEGYNELQYAVQVSKKYCTDHKEILLDSKKYFELLPLLIKYKDAPLSVPNEVPLYQLSKELKKEITVVLSGEGADELFGGYGRIFRSPFDYERIKFIEQNPELLDSTVKTLFCSNLNEKYKRLNFSDELDHFLSTYNWISSEEKRELFTEKFNKIMKDDKSLKDYFTFYFEKIKALSHYDKYLWIFEKIHLVGLLNRLDMTTMAASVEGRVPFVDHELIEFIVAMPFHYKIRWKSLLHEVMASPYNSDQISEKFDVPKYILKKAYEDTLPQEIIQRKKVGFPVPVHVWFGNEFNGYAKDILLNETVKKRGIFNVEKLEEWLNNPDNFKSHNFGLKIWMLINLELWFREYFGDDVTINEIVY